MPWHGSQGKGKDGRFVSFIEKILEQCCTRCFIFSCHIVSNSLSHVIIWYTTFCTHYVLWWIRKMYENGFI